jgi:conjugal transfer pilus assembly protein TraU
MVNLGGDQIDGALAQDIGESNDNANPDGIKQAFNWVHWYKYPLMYWLNILTDVGCLESGNMDVAYLAEVDPTWQDDALTFVLNPEAVLFGTQVAQTACVADSVKTMTGNSLPIDALFWCLGSQGGAYPLDGSVAAQTSPVMAAVGLSERMDFKLHREGLIFDSNSGDTCFMTPNPMLPKSHYRYQMVNTVPDAHSCYPFGTTTAIWEAGHAPLHGAGNFGFLIWRKRNCCYF